MLVAARYGHSDEFRKTPSAHLVHDVNSMDLYSPRANLQMVCNCFVGAASDERHEYLALSSCEKLYLVSDQVDLNLTIAHFTLMVERKTDSRHECVWIEWLLDEFVCTLLHNLDRQRNICVASHDDDRHGNTGYLQLAKQAEPIDTWHADIAYDTARSQVVK
jgi:hypothetical protein